MSVPHIADHVPELVELVDIVPHGALILKALPEFLTLFSPKIDGETVVKQPSEELVEAPSVRVPQHLPSVELIGLPCQEVGQYEDLALGGGEAPPLLAVCLGDQPSSACLRPPPLAAALAVLTAYADEKAENCP